jgi:ABC-2 type transport system ATP-binding protein
MPGTAVLSLQDVTLRYGDFVAVDALCLEVARGEIFGLLGPNGSGKSSTIAAVCGGIAPAAGVIRVGGLAAAESPDAYRRLIGLVPQELAIFEELSAADNLRFFGGLYGLRGAELRGRVAEALEFVRLSGHARRPPRTFSGGMQRRLNLACALLHRPALLLLDEPTVGLDIQSREAIFDSLRLLRDEGRAVVITTHHLEEAEQLCDRVGIMDRGRLVAVGTPAGLTPTPGGRAAGAPRYYTDPPRAACGLASVFLELTGRSLRDG